MKALMRAGKPGVFCAGEMVDWEAPTGGYLLTACLASGRVAHGGVRRWLGFASPPAAALRLSRSKAASWLRLSSSGMAAAGTAGCSGYR